MKKILFGAGLIALSFFLGKKIMKRHQLPDLDDIEKAIS